MDSIMRKYNLKNSSLIKNSRIEKSREKYLLAKQDSVLMSSHSKYDSKVDEIIQRTLKKLERSENDQEEFQWHKKHDDFFDKDVERIIQKIRANEIVRGIEQNNAPRIKIETGTQSSNALAKENHGANEQLPQSRQPIMEIEDNESCDQMSSNISVKHMSPKKADKKESLRNKSLEKFREFYNANRKSKPLIAAIFAKKSPESDTKEKPATIQMQEGNTLKNKPPMPQEEISLDQSRLKNKKSISPIRQPTEANHFDNIEDSKMSEIDFEYSQLDQSLFANIHGREEIVNNDSHLSPNDIKKPELMGQKSTILTKELLTPRSKKKRQIIYLLKEIEDRVF